MLLKDLQRVIGAQSVSVSRVFMNKRLRSNKTKLVEEINHLEREVNERNKVQNKRSSGHVDLNLRPRKQAKIVTP